MNCEEKYDVSGMSCAACSARVDKAVRKLNGVKEVNVNLLTNSMVVEYDSSLLTRKEIEQSVKDAGYQVSYHKEKVTTSEDLEDKNTPRLVKRLIISVIILIPLFYLAMGFMLDWPLGYLNDNLLLLSIIELILSLSIIVINNRFFISGTKAIIHRSPNMDTLVMLGSGTAFIYSTVLTIILIIKVINGEGYDSLHMIVMNLSFETAGMVPTLITIGKTLESYAKGKTTKSIKSLLDLSPKTAIIIKDEKEVEISINEVQIGDIFIIKPGQSVPVDGVVISGSSSIDESMLTGESIPIEKEIGATVKSATINQNGVLICRATRVGENTTINQIIKLVEKASNSKARISQIADKVSGIFVPIVICISILVFAGWMIFGKAFIESHNDINSTLLSYSIERAIAVLVISCPCALGLATPVAIMVGSGKGAKAGVLYKNASVIEETGKIDYVVFDKTGTITNGTPVVTDIDSNIDKNLFLSLVCSLEKASNHPLAKAIVGEGNKENTTLFSVDSFASISGKGIEGIINKEKLLIGNMLFMSENKIDVSSKLDLFNKLSLEGKTVLFVAKEGTFIGLIAVSDTIRNDSLEAINRIKELGITPIMLTGDNSITAQYVAKQVGITTVISNVLPEDKYDVINEIKKQGKVMMVGDGINDAIALTSADVGMAIGNGSDVAIESADIVLMKASLLDAYKAIKLSKYIYLNIKENLFWAFVYNLIMIPIAAGVFSSLGLYKLSPWMGSAAMALSSVFVVTNALRINLYNPLKSKLFKRNRQMNIKLKKNEEEKMEKVIKIDGMMCMHCVSHVKEALEKLDDVIKADVSLEAGIATLSIKKDIPDEVLEKAIKDAGYEMIK